MSKNYLYLILSIQKEVKDWVNENIPSDLIETIPDPHITVLYGCTDNHQIIKDVMTKEKLNPEISWKTDTTVKLGDVSDVLLVDIDSKTLVETFFVFYLDFSINTEWVHKLINGGYSPHLTLCWLKKGAKNDPRIKDILKVKFPKLAGESNIQLRLAQK